MKKIFIIFTTGYILLSCQSNKEPTPLLFDFEQAERFIDVMDYLEAKDTSGFAKEKLSDDLISQNLKANSVDVIKIRLIDFLGANAFWNDDIGGNQVAVIKFN